MITLDIREIPPKTRHQAIFDKFHALEPGESMLIRTDHDPKPLFYQFTAEQPGRFKWENESAGPDIWEVRITRMDPAATVASIVRDYPAAAGLFNRLGIDYCCHGDQPFEQAVRREGMDPAELMSQIRNLTPASASERLNYGQWSLSFICDFIESNHHSYVREKLPLLKDLSEKVQNAHGGQHSFLQELKECISHLGQELLPHLRKEEDILFPAIRKAEATGTEDSEMRERFKNELKSEHEDAGQLMKRIRQITNHYTPPEDACATFSYFYQELEAFEKDLFTHVHLENNILFEKLSRTIIC